MNLSFLTFAGCFVFIPKPNSSFGSPYYIVEPFVIENISFIELIPR